MYAENAFLCENQMGVELKEDRDHNREWTGIADVAPTVNFNNSDRCHIRIRSRRTKLKPLRVLKPTFEKVKRENIDRKTDGRTGRAVIVLRSHEILMPPTHPAQRPRRLRPRPPLVIINRWGREAVVDPRRMSHARGTHACISTRQYDVRPSGRYTVTVMECAGVPSGFSFDVGVDFRRVRIALSRAYKGFRPGYVRIKRSKVRRRTSRRGGVGRGAAPEQCGGEKAGNFKIGTTEAHSAPKAPCISVVFGITIYVSANEIRPSLLRLIGPNTEIFSNLSSK
ncbi:hypothetical protein EVAR_24469_1 [Eumeta japonica]|uniref:Uncharacterized protein n=1 Tax=Eumeta variegata TaxID=151549 RepID=A0A4C1WWI6_EUMVA|nr:hypothetical protein EVAR_24469_1 [Eumeta japonica]